MSEIWEGCPNQGHAILPLESLLHRYNNKYRKSNYEKMSAHESAAADSCQEHWRIGGTGGSSSQQRGSRGVLDLDLVYIMLGVSASVGADTSNANFATSHLSSNLFFP